LSAIGTATAHHESASDRVTGHRLQSGRLHQSNGLFHRSRNGEGFSAGHPFIDRFFDDGRDHYFSAQKALRFGFAAVCVQPIWVARAARTLAGSRVGVASVVAFPHGASLTDIKVADASGALANFWMKPAYRIPTSADANEDPANLSKDTIPIHKLNGGPNKNVDVEVPGSAAMLSQCNFAPAAAWETTALKPPSTREGMYISA